MVACTRLSDRGKARKQGQTVETIMEIFLVRTSVACSRLSDSGEDAKEEGTRKVGGAGKRKKEGRVSSRFIFALALSQFSGPDYLGAWNRLGLLKLRSRTRG